MTNKTRKEIEENMDMENIRYAIRHTDIDKQKLMDLFLKKRPHIAKNVMDTPNKLNLE